MNLIKKITNLLFIYLLLCNTNINAQQEGFIGEVKMFAGNFVPRGWAFCEGQLMSIDQNHALFAVIGNIYGGDGRTTFALPDLRGRSAMGAGTGSGLTTRVQGSWVGREYVALNSLNLPAHTHTATVTGGTGTSAVQLSTDDAVREIPIIGDIPAVANYPAGITMQKVKSFGPATNTVEGQFVVVTPPNVTIGVTGANSSFNVVSPSTVVRYIICIQGLIPSRE
ncbi:phage tail protein [Tenacibaculum sp. IB213877]|uniref:phage tail protein n=1 Tax=Tenacibaculum sp. IB213877 TaxID=3097351 RepID=UPI002A5AA709|nr:tail fiber protein [Tenacibaculum sp. IB213877]MDY0780098.1 tail fiber protein [Tenacibaculum sp. IB213877]